jgi:hypothetical protein
MSDAPRPPRCGEPERRQFDFWIGDWEVSAPDGTVAGRNRITSLFDGCALREEWEGVSGHRGTSLNAFSPETGRWHQTWTDSSGLTLFLEGGLQNDAMVMEGTATLPGGPAPGPVRQRITWSLLEGDRDRVRQHWEASVDGQTWETVFDGRYRRLTVS